MLDSAILSSSSLACCLVGLRWQRDGNNDVLYGTSELEVQYITVQ